MTDYVNPRELVYDALQAADKKCRLSIRDMLIRGILSGAFLGYATSLVFVVNSQGLPPIVGAILFPVGFVILVLLGLELVTGNFALLPAALLNGSIPLSKIVRNLGWVYFANLLGSVLYAALFYLVLTNSGSSGSGAVGDLVKQVAQKKTLAYATLGTSGWTTAFVKGVLCNWMVTIGAVLSFVSRSTVGKITAMWLPIMTFFALGFEHSVVNMFVVPSAMMLGVSISIGQWLFWNLLPVTLGNVIGGAFFTGIALSMTYPREVTPDVQTQAAATQTERQASFAGVAGAQPM